MKMKSDAEKITYAAYASVSSLMNAATTANRLVFDAIHMMHQPESMARNVSEAIKWTHDALEKLHALNDCLPPVPEAPQATEQTNT